MARDLKGTPVEHVVDEFFDRQSQGNKGNADVERLELDGDTLHFRIRVQHKHKVRGITIYSLTTYVEGKVNIRNPDPDDVKYRIKTPVGDVVVTIEEIIEAVLAFV